MKIKKVIELMQDLLNDGEEDVCIGWYTRNSFGETNKQDWAKFCDRADIDMDWSNAYEALEDIHQNVGSG